MAANLQLKRARERQGWSQGYVSQHIGTDAFTVSRWERGVSMPSPYFRQKLTALFGMTATELGLVPQEADETPVKDTEHVGARADAPSQVLDPAIPPLPPTLVGRDELLRQLKQRLLTGKQSALAALNGLPGVGKTALATALAHDDEIRAHFADGILWAGLGYQSDVLEVLSRWGTMLGEQGRAIPDLSRRNRPEAWAMSIRAAIGQRRMLLIIDDAWDIADAMAFQIGGPNCAHLITTRFPEIARRFAGEGAIVIRELEKTDGRLLLMRLAPEVVQAEPEEAQALITAVDGLPLALTLLGNYLRAQSYSGQPRRLRAALERLRSVDGRLRLTEPQALVGAHPSLSAGTPLSLQAVIGISDQQVSEEARATLRALAIFPPKPNTFSEEAALAVSAMPVAALDELTDAGLLESSGPEYYTLHQTIADYARANLSDNAVTARLVRYYATYTEAHAGDTHALERENSNILAALDAAFAQQMLAELARIALAFAPWLETRGLYAVAEVHLQRAQEAARTLDDADAQAQAWLYLGRLMERRGEYTVAQTYWHTGLSLARQGKQDGPVGSILMELGVLARQQGQPEQARQFLEESLTLSREAKNRRNEGITLRNLGILQREQGQPEQARQLYEESLAAFREVNDRHELARTLNNLGVLARQQGQPEQAHRYLEEALSILREVEDRRAAAIALGNLSRTAADQGQLERARQLYEEALNDFRQLGDQRSVAQVLHNLGTLVWVLGQPEQARRLFEDALAILSQLGDRRIAALTIGELGTIAREQGELERARQLLQEALDTFQQLGDRRERALAQRELGVLAIVQEQLAEAQQSLHESLATFHQLHDRREGAMTQHELGNLARRQGQFAQAQQYLDEALTTFRQLNDRRETARTLKDLGTLAREQKQPERAFALFDEALAILREAGDRREVARTFREMGILLQQQEQLENALRNLLYAAVGLRLVESPDARAVEQQIEQVRSPLSVSAFLSLVNLVASDPPEPTYRLSQAAWTANIQKLAAVD